MLMEPIARSTHKRTQSALCVCKTCDAFVLKRSLEVESQSYSEARGWTGARVARTAEQVEVTGAGTHHERYEQPRLSKYMQARAAGSSQQHRCRHSAAKGNPGGWKAHSYQRTSGVECPRPECPEAPGMRRQPLLRIPRRPSPACCNLVSYFASCPCSVFCQAKAGRVDTREPPSTLFWHPEESQFAHRIALASIAQTLEGMNGKSCYR